MFSKFFLLLLLTSMPSFADLGIQPIQAICSITLNSGEKIEGYVRIANGGYSQFYRQEGLAFVRNDSIKLAYWFNLEGEPDLIQFKKYGYSDCRLFWLHSTGPETDVNNLMHEFSPDSMILKSEFKVERNFTLEEQIVVFLELPMTLHIINEYTDFLRHDTVMVNDIKKIDFFRKGVVGQSSLIKFENEIKKIRTEIANRDSGENWVDYVEPLWHHEIAENTNLKKILRRYFFLRTDIKFRNSESVRSE